MRALSSVLVFLATELAQREIHPLRASSLDVFVAPKEPNM